MESHSSITGLGLKTSTATPSSPILTQTFKWLQLNRFLRSVLTLLILENNLSNLVFVKGAISISSIRCKTLLQSSFTCMHRRIYGYLYHLLSAIRNFFHMENSGQHFPCIYQHHLDHSRLVFSRFLDLHGNFGIVTEKPTRKTCFSSEKKCLASRIYRAKFCLGCFFEVNRISIILSQKIDVEMGESIFENI